MITFSGMDSPRAYIRKIIEKEVFITDEQENIVTPSEKKGVWEFSFRHVIVNPKFLTAFCNCFFEEFKHEGSYQVGGIEVTAIPLVTALVNDLSARGVDVNGFFIRKSRKKYGLQRMIEGEVSDKKIILVDDIINSGKSFIRQVELLESLGKKVFAVFVVLRFRDPDFYAYFHTRGITVVSLFELNDFTSSLKVRNLVKKEKTSLSMPFDVLWYFKSERPSYFHVVPKSRPALDDTSLYFGSDAGIFWALNQGDGSVAWKYPIRSGGVALHIFSSPLVYEDLVYFGACDGNFYALEKATGKKRWVYMEADWIASSPCIAPDSAMVFVGLEFGLLKRRGGVVALDPRTGEKRWEAFIEGIAHSPTYSHGADVVLCGSSDGSVYAWDTRTGKLKWRFETTREIRGGIAIDEKSGVAIFGSYDASLYALRVATGELLYTVPTQEAISSDPLIHEDSAYIASLDKTLYCFELSSGKKLWKFETKGRIFSSPIAIEGRIYIGSNDGRFYELDPETGKETGFFQSLERITTAATYNPKTKRFFLSTFANEIYCLSKKDVARTG